jgi:hypothetical protein
MCVSCICWSPFLVRSFESFCFLAFFHVQFKVCCLYVGLESQLKFWHFLL